MAKKMYIGIDGTAQKVKKIYVGVDGFARKVKKGYIGIGGVARLFWSGGELGYHGTATPLSMGRAAMSATSVGNFALFAGGYIDAAETPTSRVDAYNKSLTRTIPPELSEARANMAATTVGDYALFAGGGDVTDKVDVYDRSLTRTAATALKEGKFHVAATTVGDYALFAGGSPPTTGTWSGVVSYAYKTVEAYNKSLTKTLPTELNEARIGGGATTVGDYALFAGGYWYISNYDGLEGHTKTVEAYNKSLTRTAAPSMSNYRHHMAAATVGDYALFAGGYYRTVTNGTPISLFAVEAYDKSLTKIAAPDLCYARYDLAATTLGDFAIFAGGRTYGDEKYGENPPDIDAADKWDTFAIKLVDVYDASLTRTTHTSLSKGRQSLSAATIGSYALFAGGTSTYTLTNGYMGHEYSSIVDVYTI